MSKIRFIGINEDGSPGTIRDLDPDIIRKCPHLILVPEHYKEDGTCKCFDENETSMAGAGYVWYDGMWRSSAP